MKTISRMNEAITTTPSNIYSKREHVVTHKKLALSSKHILKYIIVKFNDICKQYNERKILTIITFFFTKRQSQINTRTMYKDIGFLTSFEKANM